MKWVVYALVECETPRGTTRRVKRYAAFVGELSGKVIAWSFNRMKAMEFDVRRRDEVLEYLKDNPVSWIHEAGYQSATKTKCVPGRNRQRVEW